MHAHYVSEIVAELCKEGVFRLRCVGVLHDSWRVPFFREIFSARLFREIVWGDKEGSGKSARESFRMYLK